MVVGGLKLNQMGISPAEYHRRLQKIRNLSVIQEVTKEIVLSDKETLKQRKIDEFTKGERPDGRRIGKYKDAEYAFFKQAINPGANGYVDLMLSRSFVGKMYVKPFTKGSFLFDSRDEKTGNLIGKYGIDIMGLNQEWFEKRQKEIYRFVLVNKLKRHAKIQ